MADVSNEQYKEIAKIEGRYKRLGAVIGKMPEDVRESYDLLRAAKAYRSPDATLDHEIVTAVDRMKPGKDGKFDLAELVTGSSERLARVGQFQTTVDYVIWQAAQRLDRDLGGHADEFLGAVSTRFNALADEYHPLFKRLPDFVFGGGYNQAGKRNDHINRGLVQAGPETLVDYRRAVDINEQMRSLVSDATAVMFGESYPGYDHWLGLQVSNWDGRDAFDWMLRMRTIGYEAFEGQWRYPSSDAPAIGLAGFLAASGAVLRMPATTGEMYDASERMHPNHGEGLDALSA